MLVVPILKSHVVNYCSVNAAINRGSEELWSYICQGFIQDLQVGRGGGGGKLKTFGVYVMGVHRQAPSWEVWGMSLQIFILQN